MLILIRFFFFFRYRRCDNRRMWPEEFYDYMQMGLSHGWIGRRPGSHHRIHHHAGSLLLSESNLCEGFPFTILHMYWPLLIQFPHSTLHVGALTFQKKSIVCSVNLPTGSLLAHPSRPTLEMLRQMHATPLI